MLKSFTLDGKRYRLSCRVPVVEVKYLAQFWHVSTTDDEIRDIIRRRAMGKSPRGDWTERAIVTTQNYALSLHRTNQRLYRYVQRGG